jgi:hypothetical protein
MYDLFDNMGHMKLGLEYDGYAIILDLDVTNFDL